MKYYVVSDVHGFYTPLHNALSSAGFFEDDQPHKLIVCGDLFDRGKEALELQQFMLDLLSDDKLIYVRGNHEDLMGFMFDDLLLDPERFAWGSSHHIANGTYSTAVQLAEMNESYAWLTARELIDKVKESPFWTTLLPTSVDFYETDHYIFVHGWIPCVAAKGKPYHRKGRKYQYNPRWRLSSSKEWETARWVNGMEVAEEFNIIEPNKTIVCGHCHTSFGHSRYEHKGGEFGGGADFTPYYGNGVIGIDGCTAYTKNVNCIVVEA